jgi:Spy/CpxP family protein refolding chaperone
MRIWTQLFLAAVILGAVSSAHAQQDPGGAPGGAAGGPGGPDHGGPGGNGPDGGPPDPREMQAMMDKRIQQNLQLTDDAWAKIQPLVDKVEQLAHEADTQHIMHHGPPRPDEDGMGPDDNDEHPKSAIETAITNLQKVLSDKSSTDNKIEAATKAAEDAEKKAADDLATARKALKAALNSRQTAVLVAMGVLD